jgi:hypothetical protein
MAANTGVNNLGDILNAILLAGVVGWNGTDAIVWTPSWVPTTSDPSPVITYPNGPTQNVIQVALTNFSYNKGVLSINCTLAGVSQNTLTMAITSGGAYGVVAWTTTPVVGFSGSPTSGTVSAGLAPSVGLVPPQPPRLTGPILFSQLPVAAKLYSNDYVLVYQGNPPIARQISVANILAATNPTAPTNTEQVATPMDKLISALGVASSGNLPDWILINQGTPPQTRRIALSDFLNQLAGVT